MPDYSKSKIYKVVCDETNLIYYGSTVQRLCQRLTSHKRPENKCNTKLMANPKIYLVENFSCDNKEELLQRERWYIENNECCNKMIPLRTDKEYREANKDKNKVQCKEYREKNKDKIKEYNEKNKDKIKVQCKEYYEKNKDKIKVQQKEYYEENKDKIKEYYEENKGKLRQKFNCDCGGKYTYEHKSRHIKSKKHQKFLNSITN